MKTTIRIIVIVVIFLVISLVISLKLDDFFSNTIYTVSGIMFSVGLGLVVTFNIGNVKNKKYVIQLRKNIDRIRNSFLKYFLISTMSFIVDYYLRQKMINVTNVDLKGFHIELNWSILFSLLMLYSIIYYIINFIEIQKLNYDIIDKTIE